MRRLLRKWLRPILNSWLADGGGIKRILCKRKAIIFPGKEDFGIVPLETMASGKPVIAYGSGGVLETAVPLQKSGLQPPTGAFFNVQTPESPL
jgi:glycosyltransferase involved in cell wall biosynthesis